MKATTVILSSCALLSACQVDLGLQEFRFQCREDADCARGTYCERSAKICVGADYDAGVSLPDLGVQDLGMRPDSGPSYPVFFPDSGVPGGHPPVYEEPVRWWWYTGLNEAEVRERLQAHEARPVELEHQLRETVPQWLYSVVMVDNSRDQIPWLFFSNASIDDVEARFFTTDGNGESVADFKIMDLEALTSRRVAAIMYRWLDGGFYFYTSEDNEDEVLVTLRERQTGFADIGRPLVGSSYEYSMIFEADAKGPHPTLTQIGFHMSAAQIEEVLRTYDARLFDLEPEPAPSNPGEPLFTAAFDACPCPRHWFVHGLTEAQLRAQTARLGARIHRLESYEVGGLLRFAAVLLGNVNEDTARVSDAVRAAWPEDLGLFAAGRRGAPMIAQQEEVPVEATDVVAELVRWSARRAIDDGALDADEALDAYSGEGCPSATGGTITASAALSAEGLGAVRALYERLGAPAINARAQALSMRNTALQSAPGCGTNNSTLLDAARLYESAIDELQATPLSSEVRAMIEQEASALMIAPQDAQRFVDAMVWVQSAPSAFSERSVYLSVGAIEYNSCQAAPERRGKMRYGLFLRGQPSPQSAEPALTLGRVELLRASLSQALQIWAQCAQ